ncbi:MAG: LysR family transcriptional regulator [Bacilli bacterium]|nr:LysR family transcriptional regulator [Bacilli bacterium]
MALPSNNINLNLYRIFYTVAKTKSFSESSRTLHISQPAISKHIQNLEYELGTMLFYRTNRGIELTPEAINLLAYVEKAYNYLSLGERELEESKELTKGKISIGVPTIIGSFYIKTYLKTFLKEHPNINVEMINTNERRLMELFNQHTIDLIILPNSIRANKEYKTVEIKQEEYCFAYSKTIPYNTITTLEEIMTKPLILPSNSTKARKDLDNILNELNLNPNPIMELDQTDSILTYTKEELGIGYLPKSVVLANPDLDIINIETELPTTSITLVYDENGLTTAAKTFITILTNSTVLTENKELENL